MRDRTRLFGILGVALMFSGMFLATGGAWYGSTVMLIGAATVVIPVIRRRLRRRPRPVRVRRR